MTEHLAEQRPAVGSPSPLEGDPVATLRRRGFTIGEWRVEPRLQRIRSRRSTRRLDPRTMDLLVYMASRAGDVVERRELLDAVWESAFVTANTLTQSVSRLRRALGDDWQRPRYLETISKTGYRLLAPVVGPASRRPGEPAAAPGGHDTSAEAVPAWRRPIAAGRVGALAVALLAFGLAGWLGSRDQSDRSPPRLVSRPALTQVGYQFFASLSPDGGQIAFAWQGPAQDNWDIYVQRVGSENPRRLTTEAADDIMPAWSADGQQLAYVSSSAESCGLFRVPAVGGPAERVGYCVAGMDDLRWSPDGTRLVFSAMPDRQAPRRIVALSLEDGELRPLTEPPADSEGDIDPALSPDGSRLAFNRQHRAARHDLMVVELDGADAGNAPRQLTEDALGRIRGLDWSADGGSIVYSSNRSGRFCLWRLPLAGGEPERLPIEDDWVTLPSIARDGSRLIYKNYADEIDLWSLPLSADATALGEPRQLVPSIRSELAPQLAPDGQRLAFLSDRSGFTEVWSGRLDATGLLRHSSLEGPRPGFASWSPEAERLVFDAAPEGHSDLYLVERDGPRPRRLTWAPSDERNGSFSADGRWLYFASNRSGGWQIWRMPAAGGAARAVTAEGGFLAREGPGGHDLYFVRQDLPGIWRMPTGGGEGECIVADLDFSDWASWTVRRSGIYFLRRDTMTIVLHRFADGREIEIHQPAKNLPALGRALSVSIDEDLLVFAMIGRSDDEILTVDLLPPP